MHTTVGKTFGMNTYIPRLAEHGLDTPDALLHMTPDAIYQSAREALAIAKVLGKKVIVMATSSGGTLALKLAADYPDDVNALVLYSPNIRMANKATVILPLPLGLQIGRMISHGKYHDVPSDPRFDPYWYIHYRLEGVRYLQILLNKTMTTKTFAKITQPVFTGYYYKDKEHQDAQVDVQHIHWMFANLGTDPSRKVEVNFPDAGDHVICCELTNPRWKEVYDATADFLVKTVGLRPVAK